MLTPDTHAAWRHWFRPRWQVRIRFRRYSRFEVVGETNTILPFWTKLGAERYARERNSTPGYVAFVERS